MEVEQHISSDTIEVMVMAGRPKYGFKNVDGKLVKVKEEQDVINLMIEMKANHATYAEIASDLNNKKIETPSKKAEWSKRSVESLLSNYKVEIAEKEQEELNAMFNIEDSSNDSNELSGESKSTLPFDDAERCGSVYEESWVKALPDGGYILEDIVHKHDVDTDVHDLKHMPSYISEEKAEELIEQYKKEKSELDAMIKRYKERKKREPYVFDRGHIPFQHSNGISQTAKERVQPTRDVMESWIDMINQPKKALPATTKRKVRQIGRILCDKLVEQTQWHLHLAQEVERLHSKIYSLEQELAKNQG